MQVIATAGHVDHGKSALVRALTGMEPDRWAEERRRGLTIDLGYAWLAFPSGQRLAFVDVPGHERFVPNMLAGVGPLPAVLFVVAADGGWMPQSEEHLAAIDALGICQGVLAVTRADLADPAPVLRTAAERIAATSLGEVEACAVSSVTGEGLPELLAALTRLAARLPGPDPDAPVRLWVDRVFSIRGSGTVVTGTLPAGTVGLRDQLLVAPSQRAVRVRGLQSLKEPVDRVSGVARVAVNLRGVDAGHLARGMALVTPGAWTLSPTVDVVIGPVPDATAGPPREFTVHIGAARTTARVRVLDAGPGTRPGAGGDSRPGARPQGRGGPGSAGGGSGRLSGSVLARLTLRDALPLHVGDRLLLRVPGARQPAEGRARPVWPPLAGATVLDAAPPPFARRGDAAAAARELAEWSGAPTATRLLRRRGLAQVSTLRALGLNEVPPAVSGEWLADPGYWAALTGQLADAVAGHAEQEPLAPGMPVEAARAVLRLPDRRLVEALVQPPVTLSEGLLRVAASPADGAPPHPSPAGAAAPAPAAPTGEVGPAGGEVGPAGGEVGPGAGTAGPGGGPAATLPEPVLAAVRVLRRELAQAPFLAPEAGRLRELGLDRRSLAAAERAGLLLRVSDQIILAPGADAAAATVLARLPQPFTTAQARQALQTTRRVAIPLLEHLDRAGITRRLPDDRRKVTARSAGSPGTP